MMINKENNRAERIFFKGSLHWIIFLVPTCVFLLGIGLYVWLDRLYLLSYPVLLIGMIWESLVLLSYFSCSIEVTHTFLIIRTGILTKKILNVSIQQLESVDVEQSLLGCMLDYGLLAVRGTGGSQACFGPMGSPLTCRRFLENRPQHF